MTQGTDNNEPHDPLKLAVWQAIQPFADELASTGGLTFMGLRNAVVEAVRPHVAGDDDDEELERILAMSEEELRADLIAEGRDPDDVLAGMKREVSAMIELVQERDRLKGEAASWRRVAERLQERVNQLEDGLRPFAAILAKGEPVGPIPRGLLDSKLTRQDLRNATQLLKEAAHAQ